MKNFESEEEYYGYLDYLFQQLLNCYHKCRSNGNIKEMIHGNSDFIPSVKKIMHMCDKINITIGNEDD